MIRVGHLRYEELGELIARVGDVKSLKTGIDPLDRFLGGFKTGFIYEISGPPASGKSWLAHKLLASSLLSSGGDLVECGAVYVDSGKQFDVRLLSQMLSGDQSDLKRVHVMRGVDHPRRLERVLRRIRDLAEDVDVRLIIIDEFPEAISKSEGKAKMYDLAPELLRALLNVSKLSSELNSCVLLINRAYKSALTGSFRSFGWGLTGSFCHYRAFMHKISGEVLFELFSPPLGGISLKLG